MPTPGAISDMRVLGVRAPQFGDLDPPSIPQNLVALAINAGRIDLSWTTSTDDFGVTGYQIFRGSSPLNTTTGTTYSDTTCQPGTLYSYTVVAFDAAGHSSAASTAGTATTPANAAPVWQVIPAQTLIVGNSYILELSGYVSDVDLDALIFSVIGTLPTGIVFSGTRLQGTPTTAGQTLTVTAQAADAFHASTVDIAFATKTADVTAPPVPTGLQATVISAAQIDLSWNASVDVAGGANELVTGTQDYRLYRSTNGTDYTLRTTRTTTTYSDTGLSTGTQYFYRLSARDIALNESAQSTAVSATTLLVDLTAPTVPTFLVATPQAAAIQFAWDASVDFLSGLATYRLYKSGVLAQSIAAPAAAASYSQSSIGTLSPAPVFTQTGNSVQIDAEGAFVTSTADNQAVLSRSISGDGVITATIRALTGQFVAGSKAGISWRESSADNAPCVVVQLRGDGNLRVQVRSTAGTAQVNVGSAIAVTAPVTVRIARSLGVFTVSYLNGSTWTLVTTQNVTMASACAPCAFASSQVAGSVCSAVFDGLSITSARQSVTYGTVVTGASWQVSAVDVAGNESAKSIAVSADPILSAIKWHPSHGVNIGGPLAANDISLSTVLARIDEIALLPAVKIAFVPFMIGALEGAKDDYSAGFALIDQFLQRCVDHGLRLVLRVEDVVYGSTGNINFQVSSGRIPAYLVDDPAYGTPRSLGGSGAYWQEFSNGVSSWFLRRWNAAATDRLIALSQAYATRYNSHPAFEAIVLYGETATATGAPEYSDDDVLTQMKRLVVAAPVAWKNTNVIIGANSGFGSDARREAFFAHMAANRVLTGGPDIRPNDFITGGAGGTAFQRILRGTDGAINYIGTVGNAPEVQGPNLGGNHTPTAANLDPTTTLEFIRQKAITLLGCNYLFWTYKTFGYSVTGYDNDIFWKTANFNSWATANPTEPWVLIHPTISEYLAQAATAIPLVTTPPSNYNGNVDVS